MAELSPVVLTPPLNVTLVRDQAGLDQLKDFFQREKIIGWDIETDPRKDYFWRRIRTIQFGSRTEQYVIDLRAFCGDSADVLFAAQGYYGLKLPESLQPVIDAIRDPLCTRDWLKVGVNLGFEYLNLYWLLGLRTTHFFDCGMVERCIWAGALGSMKMYSWFSMESMMGRYFHAKIEKELQQSFSMECELTPEQIEYAALDTRYPLGIRGIQGLILAGETPATLQAKGHEAAARQLESVDPLVLGDNLVQIAQIENDAIGAFQDMHVHGERIDREPWMERITRKKLEFHKVIFNELDPMFEKYVGNKNIPITDEEIAAAEAVWKAYNVVPAAETAVTAEWRMLAKKNPEQLAAFEAEHTVEIEYKLKGEIKTKRILKLEAQRKAEKEIPKKAHGDLKKKRTKIKNLAAKCQGNALINYESNKQLMDVLKGMKGLKSLEDTEDETLEKFDHIPVIKALRKYRGLSKEIGTYGEQWATEWVTKPCKDEGWLHPGDGRLHCIFNQYDAETGRSTSEKPNGQNIPKDKAVRSCFIVDDPDESIRISKCCEAETEFKFNNGNGAYICTACRTICETGPEEYVMVTADMSGAELRILAERADDPIWIGAFNRKEDVHSVCTEMMYAEKWPTLALPDCDYFALRDDGTVKHLKCKCPEHNELRDGTKPVNFGLPYGISDRGLAPQIKKSLAETRVLMAQHKASFPKIWSYIEFSGKRAYQLKKAFDMYGRRRLFPDPTWGKATLKVMVDREDELRLPKDEKEAIAWFHRVMDRDPDPAELEPIQTQISKIAAFMKVKGRAPQGSMTDPTSELYSATHREPTSKEIGRAFASMSGSIERQGKNHEIQGTNATIAKLAMGAGYCPAGKPYLWHTLPQYKAKLIKFVHDELVVQCPKRFGEVVAALIGDAFRRAAAERMKKVIMEFDYHIAKYWKK